MWVMVTKVKGTAGKAGKAGAKPTAGTDGGDATTGQNGGIVTGNLAFQAIGGKGGAGGASTSGVGANGGNGGNATVTINGSIDQPTAKTFTLSGEADGGDGGDGGAGKVGSNAGNGGKGGNASVSINGNIIQASTKTSTIELDATAIAGAGGTGFIVGANGNASATINGNIISYNGTTGATVTLDATAEVDGLPDSPADDGNAAAGTKTASVNGNIIQGNISNVSLTADALNSNGTASINGNIIQTGAKSTGAVTLEATGQHISITQNKFNLGLQDLGITLNEQGPGYGSVPASTGTSTTTTTINGVTTTTTTNGTPASVGPLVSGNAFVGTGKNQFNLTETANPGPLPTPDTAVINLASGNFVFNGAANTITGFANVALSGDIQGAIIGTSGNNVLSAADDTTKGTLVFEGNGGTNTITGGANALNVAYYAGRETQYATHTLTSVVGGPTGDTSTDTLSGIQRLKFLSPTHVSDIDNNGTSDLVFQNSTNGNMQVRLQAPNSTISLTGFSGEKAIGTGQFTADTDRTAGILLQNTTSGALEVVTGITAAGSTTTALTLPTGVSTAGWTAVTAGDFNGDGASDVLLQNSTTGAAEILFMNTKAGEAVGTVDSVGSVAAPSGTGWKAVSSGDFNGDGDSDILWQNTTTGQSEIYLMNGSTIASTGTLNSTSNLTAIGTGDFNGDGKSDAVFLNNTDHSAQIWLMNGTTEIGSPITVAQPTPGAGETNFVLLGAEDVNGDGISDLLWQDTTSGDVKATEFAANGSMTTVNLGSPAATFHLVASTGGG
jgi:FG-GAP-like repeat